VPNERQRSHGRQIPKEIAPIVPDHAVLVDLAVHDVRPVKAPERARNGVKHKTLLSGENRPRFLESALRVGRQRKKLPVAGRRQTHIPRENRKDRRISADETRNHRPEKREDQAEPVVEVSIRTRSENVQVEIGATPVRKYGIAIFFSQRTTDGIPITSEEPGKDGRDGRPRKTPVWRVIRKSVTHRALVGLNGRPSVRSERHLERHSEEGTVL
jgi:hypothetical protein